MNVAYIVTGVVVLAMVIGGLWLIDVLFPGAVMRGAGLRVLLVWWGLANGLGGIALGLHLPDPWYLVSLVFALTVPLMGATAEGLFLRSRRKALAMRLVNGESLPAGVPADLVEKWARRHGVSCLTSGSS